ncbi:MULTISPECIES: hypothetical protein [Nitrosomonas]|nr:MULTISPECIES: hypothetical protein [Nitrosomonas]
MLTDLTQACSQLAQVQNQVQLIIRQPEILLGVIRKARFLPSTRRW